VKHTALISFAITFLAGLAAIIIFPYYTVNPGVLIEDHLNLQNDCFACHSPGQGALTQKCIGCHNISEIGLITAAGVKRDQINFKSSTLHQSIINIQCFDCHTEHNGLSRENATLNFRHDVLPENLLSTCAKCHSDKKPDDNLHKIINADCSNCHQTDMWERVEFKHELIGDKVNDCSGCHENKKPGDAFHNGLGKTIQCVQCHTTKAWKPSTFDHTKYFRFDRNHPSNCSDCHNTKESFETYSCYNCHEHNPFRIEKEHLKEGIRNFANCVECHRSGDEDEARGKGDERSGRDKRDDD